MFDSNCFKHCWLLMMVTLVSSNAPFSPSSVRPYPWTVAISSQNFFSPWSRQNGVSPNQDNNKRIIISFCSQMTMIINYNTKKNVNSTTLPIPGHSHRQFFFQAQLQQCHHTERGTCRLDGYNVFSSLSALCLVCCLELY